MVTQGYILQRWINACGGRGHFPIKFNDSIFTVAWPNRLETPRPVSTPTFACGAAVTSSRIPDYPTGPCFTAAITI